MKKVKKIAKTKKYKRHVLRILIKVRIAYGIKINVKKKLALILHQLIVVIYNVIHILVLVQLMMVKMDAKIYQNYVHYLRHHKIV